MSADGPPIELPVYEPLPYEAGGFHGLHLRPDVVEWIRQADEVIAELRAAAILESADDDVITACSVAVAQYQRDVAVLAADVGHTALELVRTLLARLGDPR